MATSGAGSDWQLSDPITTAAAGWRCLEQNENGVERRESGEEEEQAFSSPGWRNGARGAGEIFLIFTLTELDPHPLIIR